MTKPPAPIAEDICTHFSMARSIRTSGPTSTAISRPIPEVAGKIERWRHRDLALRAVLGAYSFGGTATRSPSLLGAPGDGLAWTAMAAAVVVAFGLGGGHGYLGRSLLKPPLAFVTVDALWPMLRREARDIYLTYVREVRHPVEVGADEREHLINWLGNRIERPIYRARSSPRWVSGSWADGCCPSIGRPGAMLMYENAQGDRATILLARNTGARDTRVPVFRGRRRQYFRWIDGPLAYAISGFLDRGALEEISRAVYDHFEGDHSPWGPALFASSASCSNGYCFAPQFSGSTAHAELGPDFFDPVTPADFPKTILRYRNQALGRAHGAGDTFRRASGSTISAALRPYRTVLNRHWRCAITAISFAPTIPTSATGGAFSLPSASILSTAPARFGHQGIGHDAHGRGVATAG